MFDITVNFKDQPYPAEDIQGVKYILYDATGAVVTVGEAEAAGEGLYQVTLGPDVTADLPTGSARLEVIAIPTAVAVPSFSSLDFVVIP